MNMFQIRIRNVGKSLRKIWLEFNNANTMVRFGEKRELYFFTQVACNFNRAPFLNDLTDVRVDAVISNPISSQERIGAYRVDAVLVSDASLVKAAIKWLQGPMKQRVRVFHFTDEESQLSSGERELLSVYKLLEDETRHIELAGTSIFWGTDSTNLVAFLTKGSGVPQTQSRIFKLLKWAAEIRCVITPVHLYREDARIQEVDYLSKVPDSDNWSVDISTLKSLDEVYHFEVDMFADENNRRVQRFASKNFHAESLGVDAFTLNWNGMLWLCPPTALLVRVINRIRNCACKGILLVPNWPASNFYCEIFNDNKIRTPFVLVAELRPFIYQNEGASNTPLYGITKFLFFALYFNNF